MTLLICRARARTRARVLIGIVGFLVLFTLVRALRVFIVCVCQMLKMVFSVFSFSIDMRNSGNTDDDP